MVKFTLEHGAAGLVLTWLAFTRADVDVEADDVAWSELEFCNVTTWRSPVDDHVISIDNVPLDLVG